MKPYRYWVVCSCLVLSLVGEATPGFAAPTNFAGQDLKGKDFKDGNLNRANFDGALLNGANFRNATLRGASFQKAQLENAIFSKAVLDDADLSGAELHGVDWTDARAWHAKLAGTEIDLAGAVVVDLKKLNLDYGAEKLIRSAQRSDSGSLSFHYADLRRCKIIGNADGVDFRGADLRGTDFTKAQKLDSARFAGAKYDSSTQWNIDPARMHAELVAGSEGAGPAGAKISHHPLIGHWLILKGEKGATESGSIQIHPDGTFDWDYSQNGTPIKGEWTEAGDNIIVKSGEKGETWTVSRTHPDEILLKGDRGTERVGILNK
ncbi:pentapeptide repeat protein [Chthoniobacter flavus Ellin428]|uniref:Pentapeptide repeat protein n=1 Tax=Chthoniobacter flavus Ellin428 TaxID=497964 RepID=B4D3X4_9BACT|nr:pentapeptide repeat-containing protein [Chthoniobacter flavus]EDY18954.1 pentapeptide repeat protein [Chthoniobacter flavus Ellin428]TCO93538.1 uncharacterized protein YjbI with pentapeptide repeats [Chthoniobacter flavus]